MTVTRKGLLIAVWGGTCGIGLFVAASYILIAWASGNSMMGALPAFGVVWILLGPLVRWMINPYLPAQGEIRKIS